MPGKIVDIPLEISLVGGAEKNVIIIINRVGTMNINFVSPIRTQSSKLLDYNFYSAYSAELSVYGFEFRLRLLNL